MYNGMHMERSINEPNNKCDCVSLYLLFMRVFNVCCLRSVCAVRRRTTPRIAQTPNELQRNHRRSYIVDQSNWSWRRGRVHVHSTQPIRRGNLLGSHSARGSAHTEAAECPPATLSPIEPAQQRLFVYIHTRRVQSRHVRVPYIARDIVSGDADASQRWRKRRATEL